MLRLILAVSSVALLASAPTQADEGDLYFDLVVAPQLGWVTHPLAADATALPFSEQSMLALKPAFGLGVRRAMSFTLASALKLGTRPDAFETALRNPARFKPIEASSGGWRLFSITRSEA